MENVEADVWNAPEALFVLINAFVAVAGNVKEAKDVSMEDVEKYARYVKVVRYALTNFVGIDAYNVVVETYASTAETKTGVSRAMDQMCANTIKSNHNVWPVKGA